jgi:uroporphyrinogen decarboxylase
MIHTLKGNQVTGLVPHFELVSFPTMEAFGKVHPEYRNYTKWGQISEFERRLHREEMAGSTETRPRVGFQQDQNHPVCSLHHFSILTRTHFY